MLGSLAASGAAASTDPGSAQLGLGAESGGGGTGGRKPISTAKGVRARRGGSVCERRPHSGLGRVERAWGRQRWKLSQRGAERKRQDRPSDGAFAAGVPVGARRQSCAASDQWSVVG